MEQDQLETPETEITEELWDSTPDPTGDGDASTTEFTGADPAESSEPAPADKTTPEPEAPAPEPDPYAGLPEPVRNALSAIPQFEQRVRSAEGRVAALQRELAQRPQAPAPEPVAPRKTALDAIRDELPEVVAAIEEARANAIDPAELRKQIKAETMAELQEDLLNEAHPDWAQQVVGQEFQAWLTTQPADYQQKVKNTDKARVLSEALSTFSEAKAIAGKRQAEQGSRQRRMTAAIAPTSARRVPAKDLDNLTDDEYWDEITK